MAISSTVSSSVSTRTSKTALWLWPNVLSLDAPLIAALWQDAFARDADVRLSLASRAALPLAVWLIYLLDRLLDTSTGQPAVMTARHRFYCTNRNLCYLLTGIASCLLAISIRYLPPPVLKGGLIVSSAVVLYFLLVHYARGKWKRRLPKEAGVGLVFAAGTVVAPFARAAEAWSLVIPALLFGALCWMNSSAIEVWEGGEVDKMSAWVVANMRTVSAVACLVSLPLSLFHLQHVCFAVFVAGFGFWQVAEKQSQLRANTLRVLVDVPLLAPLLLIGLRK